VLARRVRDRVNVGAGDVESRPVTHEIAHWTERSLRNHDRMVRIQLLQARVRPNQTSRRDRRRPVRVCGLVDPFPGAERRVILQPVDDPYKKLLRW
jgi:hypothetical protein